MEEMIDLCGLRVCQKTVWLWSLHITALALSGYVREAFDVVDVMESKGENSVYILSWKL